MLDYLNNASVAAFFGAFFAFLLVQFTDYRRNRKTIFLLKIRISVVQSLAIDKDTVASTNINLINEGKFISSPIMKFPTEDVQYLLRQSLGVLSQEQITAVDALIYWMEAIDGLFSTANKYAIELENMVKKNIPNSERSLKGSELLHEYEQAKRNLGYLITLTRYYLDGQFKRILDFEHPIT